jgi:hypothetical protein
MSTYRYATTNILTGALLADTLPLHVTNFSRNLGGVGQPGSLSAYLDLGTISAGSQSAYLGALEPRSTVLWVMQDNYPIWAGIVWDWTHTSAISNQLPINAVEIGSLFNRRQIRADQVYVGADLFAVARGLISYAVGKTYGGVANLIITGSSTSGVTVSPTFPAQNLGKVLDLLNSFCAQYNFEYAFNPGLDSSGNPNITMQLGYPTIARPVANTNLQFVYPGPVTDYGYPRVGSASTNSLIATASGGGTAPWSSNPATHGLNSADLAAGYPLLEDSVSYTTAAISAQSQIDAVADGRLPMLSGTTTVPTVTVAGGQLPTAGQIQLGDDAWLVATSTLHPADPLTGAPGLQTKVRIIGWTVNPPTDQQAETTQYILGGITS